MCTFRDDVPDAKRFGINYAPVAQLDRALAYEARGRVFESPRAYHLFDNLAEQPVGPSTNSYHPPDEHRQVVPMDVAPLQAHDLPCHPLVEEGPGGSLRVGLGSSSSAM